jgi:hypothetical protein
MANAVYDALMDIAKEKGWPEHILFRRVCDYLEIEGDKAIPNITEDIKAFFEPLAEGDLQDEFGICPKCCSECGECGPGYCEHDDPLEHQPIGWLTERVENWQSANGMSCQDMIDFLKNRWGDWRPDGEYRVVIRKEGLYDNETGEYVK